ncbi:MAG: nitroreductase family protein, partial [Planctomycetota bacterium]
AMIFMLALETLGLSSCPINWPEIKSHDKRLKKVIQLENTQRCIMMISVGYPKSDALIPYSAKKSIPSLVQYNV